MKGEWDCESMRERAELSASEFEKKKGPGVGRKTGLEYIGLRGKTGSAA